MAKYISCRSCDATNCEGCNIYTLSKMLGSGKFGAIMDAHHSIIPVEVEPVKHSRWAIEKYDKPNKMASVSCPECDAFFSLGFFDFGLLYNYCPNCGTKMDLEG